MRRHDATAKTPRHVRATIAVVLGALLVTGGGIDERAAAEPGEEAVFVDSINEIRAELGLSELETSVELGDLAREHAAAMAEAGEIYHADPISAGLTAEWIKLGENVGVGAGVQVLIDAFAASPGHYANIVDPTFAYIGVGVVWKGDALYTAHRFLTPPAPGDSPPPPTPAGTDVDEDPPPAARPPADTTVSVTRAVALLALLEDVG